ncbi:hypothetical protein CYG48_17910 (plasmid) [Neorhizobium sp. SOG26]|uniref:glycosyltransferase family 39 protein n=1 Tax=Neorhizobium sp. SOG26 TaxID=2060726 RepID=UPI000E56F59C|nr:glycosyltransferase family 39 protein [Neorhizobium sp. SOG26]AXV17697.1 hypothetical protein CYG48_17910 [Neorhizobium sp. SOG26]
MTQNLWGLRMLKRAYDIGPISIINRMTSGRGLGTSMGRNRPAVAGRTATSLEDGASQHLALIILVGLLLAGAILRIANLLLEASLWEDEIFSVALAESPLADLFLTGLRFDTHPPLYYVQLHFWGAIANSDRWYILNSTLLSIVSVVVIFECCRRIYDERVGLWAAAIQSLMPLQLFFAENVRMYPMFAILAITLWYVLQTIVRHGASSRARLFAVACLGVATTLTHGLGFFVTFFIFLHALIQFYGQTSRRNAIFLVGSYVPVALTAIYPLVIGAIRRTEGIAVFDVPTIGIHLTMTLLGPEFPWPTVAGLVALPLLVFVPLVEPRARMLCGMLVLLPLFTLFGISVLFKPVFIYRTIGLFLPFLAIAMALCADTAFRRKARMPRVWISAMILTMLAGGVNYTINFEKRGYREIVTELKTASSENDVILAGSPSVFWAVTRYLDGDHTRRSALEVQPPVRDGMLRVKQKLEDLGATSLGLFGQTDHIRIADRTVYPFFAGEPASKLPAFWVLNPAEGGCASIGEDGSRYHVVNEISASSQRAIQCRRSGL